MHPWDSVSFIYLSTRPERELRLYAGLPGDACGHSDGRSGQLPAREGGYLGGWRWICAAAPSHNSFAPSAYRFFSALGKGKERRFHVFLSLLKLRFVRALAPAVSCPPIDSSLPYVRQPEQVY